MTEQKSSQQDNNKKHMFPSLLYPSIQFTINIRSTAMNTIKNLKKKKG